MFKNLVEEKKIKNIDDKNNTNNSIETINNDKNLSIKHSPQNEKNKEKENLKNKNEHDKQKNNGPLLYSLVILFIIIQYFSYIYLLEFPYLKNIYTEKNIFIVIRLIFFHIIFLSLIISLYQTSNLNPGHIPIYWGFYIGDEEYKKKRYCLICQVFKPDRAHHCSVCNICVLNMDHHCPWVNNCIGFYNKKFFIQLLFYFLIINLYFDIIYGIKNYSNIKYLMNFKDKINYTFFIKVYEIINGIIFLFLTYINFEFFKFHIKLLINNITTIENLDQENKKSNKYDIGYYNNFKQVMGKNKLFWFLPWNNSDGYPIGDGLNWPLNELGDIMIDMKSKNNSNNKIYKNPNKFSNNNLTEHTDINTNDDNLPTSKSNKFNFNNNLNTNFSNNEMK